MFFWYDIQERVLLSELFNEWFMITSRTEVWSNLVNQELLILVFEETWMNGTWSMLIRLFINQSMDQV